MIKIDSLEDVEALYHPPLCECSEACRRLASKEKTTMGLAIYQYDERTKAEHYAHSGGEGAEDVYLYRDHVGFLHEATVAELAWADANRLLDEFAVKHMREKNVDYATAMRVAFTAFPEIKKLHAFGT